MSTETKTSSATSLMPRRWLTLLLPISMGASVLGGRALAEPAPSPAHIADEHTGGAPSDWDSLERRIEVLESLLGSPSEPAVVEAPATRRASYEDLRLRIETLESKGAAVWRRVPSITPVAGGVITSPFTTRRYHPVHHEYRRHTGTDIAAPAGTPILAAADGVVADLGYNGSYGHFVDIDHGLGFVTRYGHASRVVVEIGESIRRGATIALVGSTGVATGPHLHYEIYRNGYTVDPADYLFDDIAVIGDADSGGWGP